MVGCVLSRQNPRSSTFLAKKKKKKKNTCLFHHKIHNINDA